MEVSYKLGSMMYLIFSVENTRIAKNGIIVDKYANVLRK